MMVRSPVHAAGLVLLGLGLWSCGSESPKTATPAATVQRPVAESQLATVILSEDAVRRLGITTVAVERRVVAGIRSVGGEVIAPPGQALPILAPAAGRVAPPVGGSLPAVGQRVATGTILASFTPLAPSGDLVRSSEVAIAARARADLASAEASRMEALHRDGLVSTRDLETALAERTASVAAATAAAGRLTLDAGGGEATAGIAPLLLRAPLEGIVSEVHVGAGQSVVPGAPLFTLLSADQLWVRVAVYAGDAAGIDRRASSRVLPLGSAASATGLAARPVTGPPTADPHSASVDLYYAIENAGGRFRPGERVVVELPLSGTDAQSLVVPWSAVVYDAQGGAWVYRQSDTVSFTRSRVSVRTVRGDLALLSEGPAPGTLVVAIGAAELFGTEFGAGK